MITSPKIEPRHLRLRALVYVRQSTPQQLQNNQESTRRQYRFCQGSRHYPWPTRAWVGYRARLSRRRGRGCGV